MEGDGRLEHPEGAAGVAARCLGDSRERILRDHDLRSAEAALGVGEGALQEGDQVGRLERLQGEDAAAREQRSDHLERRVLGRGAHQGERPRLDVGEERVLLSAVEAVDLVEEEDRALAGTPRALGVGRDLADLLEARGDRRERHEAGPAAGAGGREQAGEAGLARTGRAPEEQGGQRARLDQHAKGSARRHQVPLAEYLVERARPHAVGERRPTPYSGGGRGREIGK